MALEYKLSLEGDFGVSEIRDILVDLVGYKNDGESLFVDGVTAIVVESKGLSSVVVQDEFGFLPKVRITFRLNKFLDLSLLQEKVIKATNTILHQYTGEAVLLFNGEAVILQRDKSGLYLNEIDNFWKRNILNAVDLPYDFKKIDSI